MNLQDSQKKHFIAAAVYSDETAQFVSNPEPELNETVTLRLRTAKDNANAAFVLSGGKRTSMSFERSDGVFDFYAVDIVIKEKFRYCFLINYNGKDYFFNKAGIVIGGLDENYNFMIIPDYKTPDWAKGAVIYQIFTDRFYNGDKTNDVENNEYSYLRHAARRIDDWDEPLRNIDIANFYGGDLQGVIDKMGYLKDLGVEVIYFNPLFVSPSTHKYDVQDYDFIDPHIGRIINDGGENLKFEKFHNKFATKYMKRTTDVENLEASNSLFAELIQKAHDMGIKVLIDGVFNHCGAFGKWLDRENFYHASGYPAGAYREENSAYRSFFRFYDEAWPNNECYDSWWGHENHPKLFYEESPELYEKALEIGRKWVSPPFCADGWRLDVAADLGYSKEMNHRFWKDFRQAVKEANPEAIILAENYGDSSPWLDGKQWDTIMNYDAFMEPITWFLTGMEKHSEQFNHDLLSNPTAFESAMRYHSAKLPYPALFSAMNELSNHDHSRFLTRTNQTCGRLHTKGHEAAEIGVNVDVMMEAVVFQFAWQGAPCIYYGDEAGLCGWSDPDNRRTFPWGKENIVLVDLHREMIRIHKENTALIGGSTEYLCMRRGIIGFGRWTYDDNNDGGNKIVCVLNNNETAEIVEIPVWRIHVEDRSVMERLIVTADGDFSVEREEYTVSDGCVSVEMPPHGAIILREGGAVCEN